MEPRRIRPSSRRGLMPAIRYHPSFSPRLGRDGFGRRRRARQPRVGPEGLRPASPPPSSPPTVANVAQRSDGAGATASKHGDGTAPSAESEGGLPAGPCHSARGMLGRGGSAAWSVVPWKGHPMTTIARQVQARWGDLMQAITEESVAFQAEYARDPSARSFWGQVAGDPPRDASADAVDPARKRRRWLDLWGTLADRIAEREAEHVRSAPGDAAWASLAGAFLRARLLEFQRKLHVEHPDLPEIEDFPLDTATGRHRPRVSAFDTLKALHYCLFEDPESAEDDADLTDDERAEHAAAGQRLREWLDSTPQARARNRSRS